MTERIAVVGSAGFVGAALVDRLSDLGIETVPLDRKNAPDLLDQNADWASLFAGCGAVVNCAGKAHDLSNLSKDDVRTYALVNGVAPGTLARAAVAAGVPRFVQISTVKVLGDRTEDKPFTERDAPNPMGVYALSKELGEDSVLKATANSDTSGVVIRMPLVIGKPYKGNLALLQKAISAGVPLPLGHRSVAKRSYVMRDDLIDFIVRVCSERGPVPDVLHVKSRPDLTAGELAELVGAEMGRKPRLIKIPASLLTLFATAVGHGEAAGKLTGAMLIADDDTRLALEP